MPRLKTPRKLALQIGSVAAAMTVIGACSAIRSVSPEMPSRTSLSSASVTITTIEESVPPETTLKRVTATTEDQPLRGGFVAHIGCSQTKLAVRGYQELGGSRLERYEIAGGQVNLWSRGGGGYWSAFDDAVSGKEITAGWMEICITGGNERNTTYDDVVAAVTVFRSKIGDEIPIYVSGLELFEPVGSCRIAGTTIPSITREYADRLAQAGLAVRGPDLGPLTPETTIDGCHPNRAGQEIVGRQLLEFFGS